MGHIAGIYNPTPYDYKHSGELKNIKSTKSTLVYQRTYRTSSNTHPGVYFPQDSVDPVLKRDRLINGTGVN